MTHHYVARLDTSAWLSEMTPDITIRLPGSYGSTDAQIPVRITRRHHPVIVGQKSVVLYRSRPANKTPVRFWADDGRSLEIAEVRPSSSHVSVEVGQQKSSRVLEFSVSLAAATRSDPVANSGHLEVHFTGNQTEPYRVDFLILP
jgi:hypothetical protein